MIRTKECWVSRIAQGLLSKTPSSSFTRTVPLELYCFSSTLGRFNPLKKSHLSLWVDSSVTRNKGTRVGLTPQVMAI